MKVFLDIDGVMVHGNPQQRVEIAPDGFYVFMAKAIAIFNQIKVDEIILSTSHRHRFSAEEWFRLLQTRGLKFSTLTKMASCASPISRRQEIEYHISAYQLQPEEVLILDDDKSIYGMPPHLKERAIVTRSFFGLTDIDLINIQAIVQQKKQPSPSILSPETTVKNKY